jgi:outer membrane protein OmpA-like peptidoglycan-associated protein
MNYSFLILSLSLLVSNANGQTDRKDLIQINTSYVEYAPSISADGKVMVFQSDRSGDYNLYESFKDEMGEWSNPVLLKGNINNHGDSTDLIGGPSLSYDGNFICFFASFKGGLGSEDIYYSEREGENWGIPKNIGAPINSIKYEGFPSISSDGKSLYFMRLNSSTRNKMNCYTLLVSHKDEAGKWKKPYPLPKAINQGCEKFPRIMPDNETLVFSSIRENTIDDSFDLFQIRHKGDNKWTTPIWLNYANTNMHDYFATVSSVADQIYLNTKGVGGYDIHSYVIPKGMKPKKVVNVQGVVTDQKSFPLSASIKLFDLISGELLAELPSNPTDGSYTLVLKEGTYQLSVNAVGHYPLEEKMDIVIHDQYQLIKKDIVLTTYSGKAVVVAKNTRNGDSLSVSMTVLNLADSSKVKTEGGTFDVYFDCSYFIEGNAEGYLDGNNTLKVSSVDNETFQLVLPMIPKKPEVTFKPRDAKTKESININLMVKNLRTKKTIFKGKANSDTTLVLDFNTKFMVYGLAKNYLFSKETMDFMEVDAYEKQTHNIYLQPIEPGAKLTLDEVLFPSNSAELDKTSYDELGAVYRFLKYNRSITVEIAAHTDNVGSLKDNLKLSDDRAKSVVDFLISKGVDAGRIAGKGYGETQPLSSNNTSKGRTQNRRVEFRVLKVN